MNAIYAGSFDVPTLGHLDIISRAARNFGILYVGIGTNGIKKGYLDVRERKHLLEGMCGVFNNVRVVIFGGLLGEYCRENGLGVIVREIMRLGASKSKI